MEKKIICILVSMLMCFTASTLAIPVNKDISDDAVSTGLAENAIPISNIQEPQSMLFYDPAKAFVAYDPSGSNPQGPCEFDLATPGTITSLATWMPGSNGFCSGALWTVDGKLFMCDYSASSSTLYEVDPTTGADTQIGAMGVSVHAMTYDITTETAYAAGGTGNAANLYTVDLTTGQTTLVGTFGSSLIYMLMLACDGDGNMYGIDISTDSLYSIDKNTGTATLIGITGQAQNYAQDMCYDLDNDILYVAGYTSTGMLFTCDVSSGLLTQVGAFQGGAEIDAFAIPYISNFAPLTPPAPAGPGSGITNVDYTFTATTTDPENEQIYYMFDWGDGTFSNWIGPLDSGQQGSATHSWVAAGDKNVRVKAKDINDRESEWSEVHAINIILGPILQVTGITGGLFKVTAIIRNTGEAAAENVDYKIEVIGGAFLGKETTGTVASIAPGTGAEIESKLIIGLGATTVKITASTTGSTATDQKDGFIWLIYISL